MTIFHRSLPILLLLTLSLGCNVFDKIQKKIEEEKKPKVIASADGKCQLTVPGGWSTQKDLNDEAIIQVANLRAEQYAIVILESKIDFTNEMDLAGYVELVRKGLSETITTPVFSANTPITINGMPAMQFDVSGSVDNIKAKWIYTIVDSPNNFYQIATWTLASKYEANRPVLLEVIDSFREIEDSLTLPPPPAPKR